MVSEKTRTSGENQVTTIDADHVLFSLGYRHTLSFLYMEAGFYYGLRSGIWTRHTAVDGEVTTSQLCGPFRDQAKNDAGFHAEIGAMFPVNGAINLTFGLKAIIPFINSYEHEDRLKGNSCMLTAGCMYSL